MRRLAFAALLFAAACPSPDRELSRAVRAYDDALVKAYGASDPAGMSAVAARKEAERVRVLIDLKRNARLVLESRLESFEVTRADASGETATVETRERWRYHDRPLDPGTRPGTEFVSLMTMRYALVREDGRWKVASVATLTNAYLEPAGAKPPGAAAPAPRAP